MYDNKVKEIALNLYKCLNSCRKVAFICNISKSTISKWLNITTPHIKKTKQPIKVTEQIEAFIFLHISKKPEISLQFLQKQVVNVFNIELCLKTIHNIIKRNNYTYKRMRTRGVSKQKKEKVLEFLNIIQKLPKECSYCIS